MVYLYGLTNSFSTDVNKCVMYVNDVDTLVNEGIRRPYLHTYSVSYYYRELFKQQTLPEVTDFKYVLEIELDDTIVYVVSSPCDVVKGMFNKNGSLNTTLLSRKLGRIIKGVVLFDIEGITNDLYVPYFHCSNEECIKGVKIKLEQSPKTRKWMAMEDCGKYNRFECINSESCLLKVKSYRKSRRSPSTSYVASQRMVKNQCQVVNSYQELSLSTLNKVMLPFKLYMFTEFLVTPYNAEHQPKANFKPKGLWFAQGAEWLQHMKKTNYKMTSYNYLYDIEVDLDRLIFITNIKDLHNFSSKYCMTTTINSDVHGGVCMGVNWHRVVKDTKKDGILISPNLKAIMRKNKPEYDDLSSFKGMEWYLTWDIASGAIWNVSAIKNLKLIYQRIPGQFITRKLH